MDFEKVLRLLVQEFNQAGIRYALMGGFAMGALGIVRATMDLDFLVDADDLATIDAIMQKYGYHAVVRTNNVTQYVADVKPLGQVDLLHAFRHISRSMLQRTKQLSVFNGTYKIPILEAEDIIGLKVQALVNDPQRQTREFADIERIMDRMGATLDWERVKEYFSLFEKHDAYTRLKERYGNLK